MPSNMDVTHDTDTAIVTPAMCGRANGLEKKNEKKDYAMHTLRNRRKVIVSVYIWYRVIRSSYLISYFRKRRIFTYIGQWNGNGQGDKFVF